MRGEPLPCFPLALVVAERRQPRDEATCDRFWIGCGEVATRHMDGAWGPMLTPKYHFHFRLRARPQPAAEVPAPDVPMPKRPADAPSELKSAIRNRQSAIPPVCPRKRGRWRLPYWTPGLAVELSIHAAAALLAIGLFLLTRFLRS